VGTMKPHRYHSVVHLELHTRDLAQVRAFLRQLLGWRSREVGTGGSNYLTLPVSDRMGGGIVECGHQPASWLPYVRVGDVQVATEHARQLGASVLLPPREGPVGWRSVVTTPASGDLGLWQPKARWLR
jgi:predicted enzyme related to lactoylglutathione lyase